MDDNKNKKELKTERQGKKKSIQTIIQSIVWIFVLGIVSYGIFWIVTLPKFPQSEIISRNGVHFHSTLTIVVDNKNIVIPADIGISAVEHSPMHTHDSSGTIHMEYSGIVRDKNLILGNFFKIWGKDFTKKSFMGNPIGKDGSIKMTVNGKKNLELENYSMKDGDKIKIVYNNSLKLKDNK